MGLELPFQLVNLSASARTTKTPISMARLDFNTSAARIAPCPVNARGKCFTFCPRPPFKITDCDLEKLAVDPSEVSLQDHTLAAHKQDRETHALGRGAEVLRFVGEERLRGTGRFTAWRSYANQAGVAMDHQAILFLLASPRGFEPLLPP
jgi:hypothetical protein